MSEITQQPAILLIGHGTRRAVGVAEFRDLTAKLQEALPDRICQGAFLELVEPSIPSALASLRRQGVREITAIPTLLMAAGHVKNDIPALLNAFTAKYPEMTITFGAELGIHPYLLQVAQERIAAIESTFGLGYERSDTLLLVVGHGSSDPDANSNISKLTRILWESMGFAWAETAYTAVTAPLVADALERTRLLGFRQVLIFPYLLFAGRLLERIEITVADYQAQYPEARCAIAPHLQNHLRVVATFLERIAEAENGMAHMNCQWCAHRMPSIGRDDWLDTLDTAAHSDAPSN